MEELKSKIWEDRRRILELGCGRNPRFKNSIRMDWFKFDGIDKVVDIVKDEFPFPDETFDLVYAEHVMEHVQLTRDFNNVMMKIWKILKMEGKLQIKVPHTAIPTLYNNIEHGRGGFSRFSFTYYQLDHTPYVQSPFIVESVKLHWAVHGGRIKKMIGRLVDVLANLNIEACERIWVYWVGGFEEIEYVLCKVDR